MVLKLTIWDIKYVEIQIMDSENIFNIYTVFLFDKKSIKIMFNNNL